MDVAASCSAASSVMVDDSDFDVVVSDAYRFYIVVVVLLRDKDNNG